MNPEHLNDQNLIDYATESRDHYNAVQIVAHDKYYKHKERSDIFDQLAYHGEIYALKLAYEDNIHRDFYKAYLYAQKGGHAATAKWLKSLGRFIITLVSNIPLMYILSIRVSLKVSRLFL